MKKNLIPDSTGDPLKEPPAPAPIQPPETNLEAEPDTEPTEEPDEPEEPEKTDMAATKPSKLSLTKETLFDSLFESPPSSRFAASAKILKQQTASSFGRPNKGNHQAAAERRTSAIPAAPGLSVSSSSSLFPQFGAASHHHHQPEVVQPPAPPGLPLSVDIQAAQRVTLQPMFSPEADSPRLGRI